MLLGIIEFQGVVWEKRVTELLLYDFLRYGPSPKQKGARKGIVLSLIDVEHE